MARHKLRRIVQIDQAECILEPKSDERFARPASTKEVRILQSVPTQELDGLGHGRHGGARAVPGAVFRGRVVPSGPLAGTGDEEGPPRASSLRRAVPIEDAEEFHSGVRVEIRLLDGTDDFSHAIAGEEVDWASVSQMGVRPAQPLAGRGRRERLKQTRDDELERIELGFVVPIRFFAGEPARDARSMDVEQAGDLTGAAELGGDPPQLDPCELFRGQSHPIRLTQQFSSRNMICCAIAPRDRRRRLSAFVKAVPIPLLLGIATVTFVIVHLAPGDPMDVYLEERYRREVDPQVIELIRQRYGLDEPRLKAREFEAGVCPGYIVGGARLLHSFFGEQSPSGYRNPQLTRLLEVLGYVRPLPCIHVG